MLVTSAQYQNFLNGRYFYEGVRVTLGILIPALLWGYFDRLDIGIMMSLGAMAASIADSPGPVHHRRNSMVAAILLTSIIALLTGIIFHYKILLFLWIGITGFLFSMLSVYGQRISAIGVAALVIMVLSLEHTRTFEQNLNSTLYLLCGGTWYLLFSMVLYMIRPYKIIQQVLGDYLNAVGDYFRIRSKFYDENPDIDEVYKQLFTKQAEVLQQQTLVSELLFKTRAISRESTNKSRRLMKIYLDTNEMFDSIMTSYQKYDELHKRFGKYGILQQINSLILSLSEEISSLGLTIKKGDELEPQEENRFKMANLKADFEALRIEIINPENVESFVALGRIVSNIQHIHDTVLSLHYYAHYKQEVKKGSLNTYEEHGDAQSDFSPRLLLDNINLRSNIFRHSLRVAVALMAGYLTAVFFNLHHYYWILLTIVVILKPAYSLTKQRNGHRLWGTLAGLIIGVLLILLLTSKLAMILLLAALMVITYTFLRTNYLVSVIAMTSYLVIFFFLLSPHNIMGVMQDRLVDTAVGSLIAFVVSLVIVPTWEHKSVMENLIAFLDSANPYYQRLSLFFSGKEEVPAKELAKQRKQLMIALANLSESFNRMVSEPKRMQKGMESMHQFLSLSHILSSHLSTLNFYSKRFDDKYPMLITLQRQTSEKLSISRDLLFKGNTALEIPGKHRAALNFVEELTNRRKEEVRRGELETGTKKLLISAKAIIDQFYFIDDIATTFLKIAGKHKKEI